MVKKIKQKPTEREYIINLRSEIAKVPNYKRTPKAVKALKQFIARHMRIPDRDTKKVKIDKWLNRELWFRGIKNPPTKLKVKAKYQNENVIVELSELPEKLKFEKLREEKSKQISKKIKDKIKEEKKVEEEVEKKEIESKDNPKEEKPKVKEEIKDTPKKDENKEKKEIKKAEKKTAKKTTKKVSKK